MKQSFIYRNSVIQRYFSDKQKFKNVLISTESEFKDSIKNIIEILEISDIIQVSDIEKNGNHFSFYLNLKSDRSVEDFKRAILLLQEELEPQSSLDSASDLIIEIKKRSVYNNNSSHLIGLTNKKKDDVMLERDFPYSFFYIDTKDNETALKVYEYFVSKGFESVEKATGTIIYYYPAQMKESNATGCLSVLLLIFGIGIILVLS